MRKSIILAVLMTVALTARADNKADTLYVTTTPQMHCANCENKIKNNLRFEKGVKKIETSVADQRVTVIYNPRRTSSEKLIKSFGKFGYTARAIGRGEKVKLTEGPEKCDNM
jgi:copper chaperone CopZ